MSWYEDWFKEDYLAVYSHRGHEAAKQESAFVAKQVELLESSRLLDLACGAGRHLLGFGDYCKNLYGMDLSEVLLLSAKDLLSSSVSLARGDLRRLPFHSSKFNVVTSFFTSFGYFKDEEDHGRVVNEVYRILQPKGVFMIDYFNPEKVLKEIIPISKREVGGRTIEEERTFVESTRRLEKKIRLYDTTDSKLAKEFMESVRVFSRSELLALFESRGFSLVREFGDFTGAVYNPQSSNRLVMFVERQ